MGVAAGGISLSVGMGGGVGWGMSFAPDAYRIFVSDLKAAGEFYGGILGWPLQAQEEGWLYFAPGTIGVVLELVHPGHPEDEGLVGRFTGLSLTSDNIQADYEKLKGLGVAFTHAPSRREWGGWLADFMDVSGNTLTLVQREG